MNLYPRNLAENRTMKDKTNRVSKFLSYVLRHNPAELDLELDKSGWMSISHLIGAANEKEKNYQGHD